MAVVWRAPSVDEYLAADFRYAIRKVSDTQNAWGY